MTDFKPLCPPADPRARARSLPSGSCTSSTTISRSADVDLEVPRQLADRLAAEVHERQRLGQQRAAVRPTPLGDQRLGRRRLEPDRCPPREFVDHREPDVVPRALVLRARIAEPNY